MRTYEMLTIYSPDITEAKLKDETANFKALLESNGGTLVKADIWGRKEIAYKVKKFKYGNFVIYTFSSDNSGIVQELERVMRISDKVIKFKTHLIVTKVRKTKKSTRPRRDSGIEDFFPGPM